MKTKHMPEVVFYTPANENGRTTIVKPRLKISPALAKIAARYLDKQVAKSDAQAEQDAAKKKIVAALGHLEDAAGCGFEITNHQADGGAIDWQGLALKLGATEDQIRAHQRPGSKRLYVKRVPE